jgi:non-canonical poly(A) RNA polymerase PAPD5/7
LNLEIQKFHNFIQPSQAETVARKHVIEQVRQHVQNILPGYALEVFGSQRTGLAFAASDVDLRLVPVHVLTDAALAKMPPSSTERSGRFVDLRALFKALRRRHGKDYLLPVLRWARYPLISLHDRASGLVLSNDTSVSREYMQRYMREYPYLPRLYSTLKASLDVRGLSDVFRGGIGSYSLFMMIVASLKHKPHPRNDAAGALIHFLDFWVHLKAELHGVSIDPPKLFSKSEQVVMHRKALAHVAVSAATMAQPANALTSPLGR